MLSFRIAGRWTHIASGRVYNTEFNPPKVPGIDDVTGEKLIQRDDDKPEAVRQRLQTYEANIKPILEFYDGHGILKLFKGRFTNEIWPKVHGYVLGLEIFLYCKRILFKRCLLYCRFLSESIPKSN